MPWPVWQEDRSIESQTLQTTPNSAAGESALQSVLYGTCVPHRARRKVRLCKVCRKRADGPVSLKKDRRPLRSQNVFLDLAGRRFGELGDEGHTVRRVEVDGAAIRILLIS